MAHSFYQVVISNCNVLVITKNNVLFLIFCFVFPCWQKKANAISHVSNQYSGWITHKFTSCTVDTEITSHMYHVGHCTMWDIAWPGKKGLYRSLRQAELDCCLHSSLCHGTIFHCVLFPQFRHKGVTF